MNILSIQSHVAYGHVGNASAVFPMQRLGHEVWPINTVQFSNHTGYGAWRGPVFSAETIREVLTGVEERGVLPGCDGVLSGYMGDPATGAAILEAAARVKAANSRALYCCDPVIGDVGRGVFVRAGIPEFMRDRAIPTADVATPNQFELEFLTGVRIDSLDSAKAAAEALRRAGPETVLVTSLQTPETPEDAIELLAVDGQGAFRLRTPLLPVSVNGAGDAVAALFFVHLLTTGSAAEALAMAGSSIYGVLKATAEAGSRELLTVAAQDEFVRPSRMFDPEAI
ncbi:pyridoxal kinase PdxY [Hansschlegelia sp.]|uniref:pyridoxal kinase PdxY n=1 Tax=Hansschlegelia sp. TaxID=2041892 RepID=UPI002C423FD1|nr:pyridoxal kinase PdxY [Hansschlegelia sp.]HVI28290.1 pyridoxal kinase PdxY [Hansschlegelia sp.]